MLPAILLGAAVLAGLAMAHGDHSKSPSIDPNADWMTKHMAEEHHAGAWDEGSFFALHDYDSDGFWTAREIQRTYGLLDESNDHIAPARKEEIAKIVLGMLDTDRDGVVSRREWAAFLAKGSGLPDMGTGPGHHGDDEYEYEIHHWEKYHDDDTRLEDLTHPEDIAHFKKHEELEEAQARLEEMDLMSIIVENIPQKFLRV
ncbi:putative calcium-binding protein [Escovopsis weberi]|uniref:Putative calcium-binding protein n=1 Tax=Escovopsis weberi TaxID=150374 RepID=A0A0M8N720_ESCWE|nr:putative calcium-binding protein [Escovopsis weberi]